MDKSFFVKNSHEKIAENLLEISAEHGTNKPYSCRMKNVNMAPWIEAPTTKVTARHESVKEKKLKNFVKDCQNCRKLTKNCTYSCRNRMKFTYLDDVSKYMRDYHEMYSTTGHVTHQTPNSVATEECVDTLPILNQEVAANQNSPFNETQELFITGHTASKHRHQEHLKIKTKTTNARRKMVEITRVQLPDIGDSYIVTGKGFTKNK
ncbi:uncharacterized protein LOC130622097 [Hydractinia symbiolongicarpus]|uniref:uncharacterized protein LOC130622097 n=1 Tax=Hydractinia symbiolongicarpus TaxID=13093 RepID=UPI00254CF09B|nr:uncharacterized protein LOC130622097 [Hydractinia symbiolongicarpus]